MGVARAVALEMRDMGEHAGDEAFHVGRAPSDEARVFAPVAVKGGLVQS